MSYVELVLDIGAKNTYIGLRKDDLVMKEASIIAVNREDASILEMGSEAEKLNESKPYETKLISPFSEGAIINNEIAYIYIKMLLEKVVKKSVYEPQIVAKCTVPCGLESEKRNEIFKLLGSLNVGPVSFIETPVSVFNTIQRHYGVNSGLIIDIGHSKTDIGLVHEGKLISGVTLMLGSKHIDIGIRYIVEELYDVSISTKRASFIKEHCAGLIKTDGSHLTVEGIDKNTGKNKIVKVSSYDIYDAVCDTISHIGIVANSVMNEISLEASQSVRNAGVFLCGGGAKMPGVDKYLAEKLGMQVRVPKKCDMCALFGLLL